MILFLFNVTGIMIISVKTVHLKCNFILCKNQYKKKSKKEGRFITRIAVVARGIGSGIVRTSSPRTVAAVDICMAW